MNRVEFLKSQTPPKAAWAVVAVGWAIAVGLGIFTIYLHRASAMSHRTAHEDAAALRMPTPRVSEAPPYEADARAALKLNSNALDDALHQIEGVSVVGVQLRSVDVDLESGRAQVTLDFKDVATLKEYLEQINSGLDLNRWLLKKIEQRRDVTGASTSLGAVLERAL